MSKIFSVSIATRGTVFEVIQGNDHKGLQLIPTK